MSRETKNICDLCGKEIKRGEYYSFKFQETIFEKLMGHWKDLDCHKDCFFEFMEYIKEKGAKEQ